MFDVIFSFRCKERDNISAEDCFKAIDLILAGVERKNTTYLHMIDDAIRPMCQLTAGLHLNIEELVADNQLWYEFFGKQTDTYKTREVKWIKRIDNNFIKICLSMKGTIIFLPVTKYKVYFRSNTISGCKQHKLANLLKTRVSIGTIILHDSLLRSPPQEDLQLE